MDEPTAQKQPDGRCIQHREREFYAGKGKEYHTKEFRPKDGRKQARCALEIHQYFVDDTQCEMPLLECLITEPITVGK